MKNTVQKWGNSLGLRIPAAIAAEMNVSPGTPVTLTLADGALTVRVSRRARRPRKHNLKTLLSQITPDNLQPTYNWGPDRGQERQ